MTTQLPANLKVINSRAYTGNSDPANKPRAGMDEFIRQAIRIGAGAFFNLGSWGQRNMRGSETEISVHACGRAVDLGYTKDDKHPNANRKGTTAFIETCVANANILGIECVLDYFPQSFGRGWRCDRQGWQKYTKATIHGAPGGLWYHVEINPHMADNPNAVKQAFEKVWPVIPN